MGSLQHRISSAANALYGINILETLPPGQVGSASTNIVAMIADLPWGPVNVVTTVTSAAQFLATFCPVPFGAVNTYTALRALLNKTFPGSLKVVRIAPTSVARVSASASYTVAGGAFVGTANYPGLLGSSIVITWAAATDADAAHRNLTISIGSTYSITYANVTLTSVLALGDPYITWTATSSPSALPAAAVAATSTVTGVDGTALAVDYVGSSSSNVGIRLFYGASAKANVLFVAEPPEGLKDTINTGIKAWGEDMRRGIGVLCTKSSQSVATALTYVASYRSEWCCYTWPMVKTTNTYDGTNPTITVDGASFAAAMFASVPPELGKGGATSADYLKGITDLETTTATPTDLKNLNDAGVAPWFIEDTLGPILHRGVSTSLTSGLTKLFRRTMASFLEESVANRLVNYVERMLDISLSPQRLGPVTSSEIGEINQFLEDLKTGTRIEDYNVDPYGLNTQTNIDAGTFIIGISVNLYAMQEAIVLNATIGEGVVIVRTAA